MKHLISTLIEKLDQHEEVSSDVITWASPVISFGDYSNSDLATIGINPSNLEFVDKNGHELGGNVRRFHTLSSLNLKKWSDASDKEIELINNSYIEYFKVNPYDRWFKKLDYIISSTGYSYYFPYCNACHLDLVPYATSEKWSNLSHQQKKSIFEMSGNVLTDLIKESNIKLIVLNGQTVVNQFVMYFNLHLTRTEQKDWALKRTNSVDVVGYSYKGVLDSVNGFKLKNKITILGYNHNIQSSFGVTKEIQESIRKWIKSNHD